MNKRIDLTQLGGFPLTQDVLGFLQTSYREAFKGIAALCGDKTILSGVVVAGPAVSDGWISYGGELIPFIGGIVGADVVVEETSTTLLFEDGVDRPVLFTKVAYCGAPATFPFSDLKALILLNKMWQTGDVKAVNCNDAYVLANFDITGLGIADRVGWAICNGANGTADMRGRFVVGYDDRAVDPASGIWDIVYNGMGATGGEKAHTLVKAELPAEGLKLKKPDGDFYVNDTGGGGAMVSLKGDSDNAFTNGYITTENMGSGIGHENRPPFIVTLFIQKL